MKNEVLKYMISDAFSTAPAEITSRHLQACTVFHDTITHCRAYYKRILHCSYSLLKFDVELG